MTQKPTYEELEQRIKELEQEALERKHADEELRESNRRLQLAYDQSIVYAQHLNKEITERKRAEENLRQSEANYRLLFSAESDAIIVVDAETKDVIDANEAALSLYGYGREELLGLKAMELSAEQEKSAAHIEKVASGQPFVVSPGPVQRIHKKKDGTIFPVEISSGFYTIRDRKMVCGIIRDITESKRAEEKLLTYHKRLRSLASELSLAEERERRRIATEVHDRIGQNLAFAKLSLGTLLESVTFPDLRTTVDEVSKLIDEIIQDTRSLISELSSPVLYELGFVPAVQWLTQQTSKRHSIPIDFEDDGEPKPLSDDVRVLLFQAVRELLANVIRHSRAQKAKVTIGRNEDQIRVNVCDDGIGFDPAEVGLGIDKNGAFGLFSIRERLEPLGGQMKVACKPGRGTQVTLVGPVIS